MRRLLILALAAAAIAVPAATPAQQPPAQRDWTQTVAVTPEGGFRMGNPAARVKVVEYLSLTCPHCAAFAHEGTPRLIADHVRTGRVSLEYRNYVLNAYDLAATSLTRCAAPARYFAMSHELLGTQSAWMGRMQNLSDAQRSELRGLQPLQAMQRIATLLGLDAIAARHGIAPAAQRACLSNQAAFDRIGALRQAAAAAGVNGTPTFAINGQILQVNDWPSIQQAIRQAGG
jgi:protein-disulfide isomerase